MVIFPKGFCSQLSPSSIVSNTYTYDLKIVGADALYSVYDDVVTVDHPSGYPSSKLVHYLIINGYGSMVSDLNNMLPSAVMFNIYVSNGTKTVFWCNCFGDWSAPLPSIDPVTVSHCIVAIDPAFYDAAKMAGMVNYMTMTGRFPLLDSSDLYDTSMFRDYSSTAFNVILEMWYI